MASYLTQEDVNNFGGELIDVAQRAALHAVGPHLQEIEQRNARLRDQLAQTIQRDLHREVEAAVPNWREVNSDPRWLNWLNTPDSYSGIVRQRLLDDACAAGAAQRVINLFRGFLREAGQPGQAGQSAGPRTAVLPSGGIYDRQQILEMARRRQRGLIDDATWRRWEYELCRASKEGRVRGALSLDDGLPVTR